MIGASFAVEGCRKPGRELEIDGLSLVFTLSGMQEALQSSKHVPQNHLPRSPDLAVDLGPVMYLQLPERFRSRDGMREQQMLADEARDGWSSDRALVAAPCMGMVEKPNPRG